MNGKTKFRTAALRKLLTLVERKVVREHRAIGNIYIQEPAEMRYDCPPDDGKWQEFSLNENWGSKNQWTYFKANIEIPADWQSGAVDIRIRHNPEYKENISCPPLEYAGPEGQIFINGKRVGAIDREHHSIRYPFKPGQSYDVRAVFFAARVACCHEIAEFSLAQVDAATEKLFHDLRVTLDVIKQLDESSSVRWELISIVEETLDTLDKRQINEAANAFDLPHETDSNLFYASVPAAQQVYDKAISKIRGHEKSPHVVAVGHAHIDLAWLWPISQTHHKCVRTFSTQCRLLEQYDDWIFQQSSPQAYKWIEQDAPDLFKKIRQHISSGRWEADGAMWCEPDTNLPSGESLVRQLLYGKRYFKGKLGIDSKMLWLPDVFGYSAALPQILNLAGVDSFVTSKISWSQYNRFPHDTFRWKGIDGTETPTHFITTPYENESFLTYNAKMEVSEVKATLNEYRQKSMKIAPLMSFGYGDGGGGPTELMLETAGRLEAIPSGGQIPRIKHEKVGRLMERISAKADDLPVWDGELYLEYHRGTYTSQAWLKRANRKNEIHLHNFEWLASIASQYGYKFDKAVLDSLWEDLLLCQFHDILPGSSVEEVYRDEVRPMQDHITRKTTDMTAKAAEAIYSQIDTSNFKKPVVLFNTLSWDRTDSVQLSDGTWRDDITIPAGGWIVIDAVSQTNSDAENNAEITVVDNEHHLENRFWRLRLDEQGRITELYDKIANRQILHKGSLGSQWQVFEDRPLAEDAWNIDLHYEEHPLPGPECVGIKVAEDNTVCIAVELQWLMPAVGQKTRSRITQRIVLYSKKPRIDFETTAQWHEHHQLLKVAFPVDIRATEATYNIQFGHIKRPTHRNTSWDLARFEVSAHQFVDLSEHGYGVSLLNDCKYGHDIHEGVIRLTCIKCPQAPDPTADQGFHEFTYSLLPHAGSFQEANVIQAAAELNNPLLVFDKASHSGGELPTKQGFVSSTNPAVIVDTVKPAEDDEGIVVRLYESHGSQAPTTLIFNSEVTAVQQVNLLEEPLSDKMELLHEKEKISLQLSPFQIVTLKIDL
ncbi:MAG: alpha-mannosidase [Planctomycetota bacterium]